MPYGDPYVDAWEEEWVQLDGYFRVSPRYVIRPTSCQCGGRFAWLKIRELGAEEMIGCVCHTPLSPEVLPTTQVEQTLLELILQFFTWTHLPPHLQEVSQPFQTLAKQIVDTLPRNPERTAALRKLLEAKDAAVRARLYEG